MGCRQQRVQPLSGSRMYNVSLICTTQQSEICVHITFKFMEELGLNCGIPLRPSILSLLQNCQPVGITPCSR